MVLSKMYCWFQHSFCITVDFVFTVGNVFKFIYVSMVIGQWNLAHWPFCQVFISALGITVSIRHHYLSMFLVMFAVIWCMNSV